MEAACDGGLSMGPLRLVGVAATSPAGLRWSCSVPATTPSYEVLCEVAGVLRSEMGGKFGVASLARQRRATSHVLLNFVAWLAQFLHASRPDLSYTSHHSFIYPNHL